MRCFTNAAHEAGVECWVLFLEIKMITVAGSGYRPGFEPELTGYVNFRK